MNVGLGIPVTAVISAMSSVLIPISLQVLSRKSTSDGTISSCNVHPREN